MAIAFLASKDLLNNGGTSSGSGPYTYSQVFSGGLPGTNTIAWVGVAGDVVGGADDVTGVTYDGVAMTLLTKSTALTAGRIMYLYYLINPGSNTSPAVVITHTSQHYIIAIAVGYQGVYQASEPDTYTTNQTNTGGATSLTTPLTTGANNCWTILFEQSYAAGNVGPTAGTNATETIVGAAFGQPALFDSNGAITPAQSFSMTTNVASGSIGIAHIMVSIFPDTYTPSSSPKPNMTDALFPGDIPTMNLRSFINLTE